MRMLCAVMGCTSRRMWQPSSERVSLVPLFSCRASAVASAESSKAHNVKRGGARSSRS